MTIGNLGVMIAVRTMLAGFIIWSALVCVTGTADGKPLPSPVHIAAVDVSLAGKIIAPTLTEKIGAEVLAERDYYGDAGRAVVMHVTVEKLKLKSVGKAMLSNVPIAGMFAGTNENMIRARVKLVDQLTGETIGEYDRIEASDSRGISAGDVASELGATALSFLPIPFVGEGATMAGDMAASTRSRDIAEIKMSRNLAQMAFYQIYGKTMARAAAQMRKSAAVAARLAAKQPTALAPSSDTAPVGPNALKAPTTEPAKGVVATPTLSPQSPML